MSHLSLISCLQLHTSELNDGYDWGRLNLQSVTEQSSMDDFLATAELAGTEFVAGKRHKSPQIKCQNSGSRILSTCVFLPFFS